MSELRFRLNKKIEDDLKVIHDAFGIEKNVEIAKVALHMVARAVENGSISILPKEEAKDPASQNNESSATVEEGALV